MKVGFRPVCKGVCIRESEVFSWTCSKQVHLEIHAGNVPSFVGTRLFTLNDVARRWLLPLVHRVGVIYINLFFCLSYQLIDNKMCIRLLSNVALVSLLKCLCIKG